MSMSPTRPASIFWPMPGDAGQQRGVAQVGLDRLGHARVLHLHDHLAVAQVGHVHLADRRGGDGAGREPVEQLRDRRTELLLDDGLDRVEGHRRGVGLEDRQRAAVLGRDERDVHEGQGLADLHGRALHLTQRPGDVLGGGHEPRVEGDVLGGVAAQHPHASQGGGPGAAGQDASRRRSPAHAAPEGRSPLRRLVALPHGSMGARPRAMHARSDWVQSPSQPVVRGVGRHHPAEAFSPWAPSRLTRSGWQRIGDATTSGRGRVDGRAGHEAEDGVAGRPRGAPTTRPRCGSPRSGARRSSAARAGGSGRAGPRPARLGLGTGRAARPPPPDRSPGRGRLVGREGRRSHRAGSTRLRRVATPRRVPAVAACPTGSPSHLPSSGQP